MSVDWADEREELYLLLLPLVIQAAQDGALSALDQLPDGDTVDIDEVNDAIVVWAEEYTRTLADGITDTSQAFVIEKLAETTEPDVLLEELTAMFGMPRAEMIGITEVTRSLAMGLVTAVGVAGVAASFRWDALADADNYDPNGPCVMNDGEVRAAGESFPSGDTEPPSHPGCRCELVLVL